MKKLLKVMLLNDDFYVLSPTLTCILDKALDLYGNGCISPIPPNISATVYSRKLLNLQGPFDWKKFWNKSVKKSAAYFLSVAHHGSLTEWAQCLLVFNPIISFNLFCKLKQKFAGCGKQFDRPQEIYSAISCTEQGVKVLKRDKRSIFMSPLPSFFKNETFLFPF